MHNKGYIKLRSQRIILLFKSIGFNTFLPVIIINVLVPLLTYLSYRKYGIEEELLIDILRVTQVFIPFCSVWWVIFIKNNFIENNGNELMYVSADKGKLIDVIIIFLISLINISLLYVGFICIFPVMTSELLKMICVSVMLFGLVNFIENFSGSLIVSLLSVIIYTLINILFCERVSFFPFYYTAEPVTYIDVLIRFLPMLITGVIFSFVSTKLKKIFFQ